MYQWAEDQIMPLGPGILWTPTEYGFRKNVPFKLSFLCQPHDEIITQDELPPREDS